MQNAKPKVLTAIVEVLYGGCVVNVLLVMIYFNIRASGHGVWPFAIFMDILICSVAVGMYSLSLTTATSVEAAHKLRSEPEASIPTNEVAA